jgi:hypothetical protein
LGILSKIEKLGKEKLEDLLIETKNRWINSLKY